MAETKDQPEWRGVHWRYQPVYTEDEAGHRCYSLCECHFDAEGNLVAWTENPAMAPSGETPEELAADLGHMLANAGKWKAVKFGDMKVGMSLDRR